MQNDDNALKKVGIIAVLVIAIVLAAWSGYQAFGPKGRTIGTLGAISEKTNRPEASAVSTSKANPVQSEKSGEASLSGAPADAGTKAPP